MSPSRLPLAQDFENFAQKQEAEKYESDTVPGDVKDEHGASGHAEDASCLPGLYIASHTCFLPFFVGWSFALTM